MGLPQNGWYIMENPKIKWMRTGSTLISGNPHMFIEGSLEVKLPTIWRDEKQSREEA